MKQQRYVLLDRDGVINEDSDNYIKSPEEWQPIKGSLEAIALLNQHGYQVSIITNQSSIGRGFIDLTTLDNIHTKMRQLLSEKAGKIAAIYYCPHTPEENCLCRKPKPGLLQIFSKDTGAEITDIFFIGDSWSDIEAARLAKAKPILVKTGKGLRTIAAHPDINIPIFENLYAAVQFIIETQNA